MTDIKNEYCAFAELSEDDADLYAGRAAYERLEAGRVRSGKALLILTRMQLTQSMYRSCFGDGAPGTGAALQSRLDGALGTILAAGLGAFPRADRRGILCGVIDRASRLLGNSLGTYEVLSLPSQPTELLETRCVQFVKRLCLAICDLEDDGEPPRIDESPDGAPSRLSAAAGALSQYLNRPELWDCPELTAATAAAAEAVARCAREASRDDALELFGFAALILSGELALDALIPASVHDTAEAWPHMLRERFWERLRLLNESLALMAGMEISGVAGCVRSAAHRVHSSLTPLEPLIYRAAPLRDIEDTLDEETEEECEARERTR